MKENVFRLPHHESKNVSEPPPPPQEDDLSPSESKLHFPPSHLPAPDPHK